jgi:hypothetical protein
MGYVGVKPSAVPLTSADITDNIIVNADINSSAAIALTKLASTGTLTVDNIQFPATQVASANANTLDDYEEGTWTPANATVTLSTAIGKYTKIGNTVLLRGYVVYPSTASGSNGHLSGLPFTAENTSVNFQGTVGVTDYGSDNLHTFVFAGNTDILVRNNTNGDIALSSLSTKSFAFMAIYNV